MVYYAERRSETNARFSELRMIEQIEYFSAKLQFEFFGEVECLVS